MATVSSNVEYSTSIEQQLRSGHARMTEFAQSFPTLRNAAGVAPWDQFTFASWASKGKSTAERQAAAFVLSVWNGSAPADGGWWNQRPYRVGRFDVVHALAVWDYEHQAAFRAWCESPFWP